MKPAMGARDTPQKIHGHEQHTLLLIIQIPRKLKGGLRRPALLGRDQAAVTAIRRGFACSAFGMLSFRTPLERSAAILSGSSSWLSVKVR